MDFRCTRHCEVEGGLCSLHAAEAAKLGCPKHGYIHGVKLWGNTNCQPLQAEAISPKENTRNSKRKQCLGQNKFKTGSRLIL